MKSFYKQSALTLAILSASASYGVAAEEKQAEFTVSAQPLAAALKIFSEQSGLQIGYDTDLAKGIRSTGVSNVTDPAKALENLLSGTGLTYEFINDDTVILKAAESPQDSDNGSEEEVDEEIVVLGQRNVVRNRSKAVEPTLVYEAAYFERFEPLTLNDMLKRVPGVFFDRLFNLPDKPGTDIGEPEGNLPRFRNLDAQFSQILVNGRHLSGIDLGSGAGDDFLTTIPAEAVKEINVIRSPSADIDSSGVGLTLNVILKDGGKYQSNSWRAGGIAYKGDIHGVSSVNLFGSTDTFNYSLGLTYQERATGGRVNADTVTIGFAPTPETSNRITDSQQVDTDKNFLGSIDFNVSDNGRLKFEGRYFQTDSVSSVYREITNISDSPFVSPFQINVTDRTEDNLNSGLTVVYQYGIDGFSWESELGWDKSELDTTGLWKIDTQPGGRNDSLSDVITADSREYLFKNHFSWDFDEAQTLKFGVDWRNTSLVNGFTGLSLSGADIVTSLDTQDTERLDFFAIYEASISDSLILQVGGRYETADYDSTSPPNIRFVFAPVTGFAFDPLVFSADVRSDFSAKVSGFNPSVHLKWSFAENQDLRLSVAQTVRRPNLSELDPQVAFRYSNLNAPLGNSDNPQVLYGNPDVENEVALGLDIGYDWYFDGGVLGINVYRRDVEDRIVQRLQTLEQLKQATPAVGAEIERFLQYVDDNNLPGGSSAARIITRLNSENTTKAQGVEVDLSVPVSFISDTANFYFNATYSTQTTTGESTERSTAINFSYDHLIESIGFTYGFSYNQITNFESSSFDIAFGAGTSNTLVRELDPNVEVFVEQKFGNDLVARLTVENVLDARETSTSTEVIEAFGFDFSGTEITDTAPRVVLTLRGAF